MTMDITLDPPRPSTLPKGAVTNRGASYLVASGQVAARTLKKFVRTPALIVAGTAQGVLFLLIFRYVFGGAVAHTGNLSYVDFLVPGFVVTGVLFQGMGAASGVADDLEGGLFDRLRSLPIRLLSIITGRVGADSALVAWGVLVMTAVGFAVGFRIGGSTADALAALGLTILYGFAFVWMFIFMGLAAGSPQAAQGLSFLVFPLSFVSSAYVPVATMPGWMQGFADQPADDADGQHGPAAHGWPGGAAAPRPHVVVLPGAVAPVDGWPDRCVRAARRVEAQADVVHGDRIAVGLSAGRSPRATAARRGRTASMASRSRSWASIIQSM